MKKLAKWRRMLSVTQKMVRVMKISVFLIFISTLQISASEMLGQQVSIQSDNMTVRQVFKELKKQTGTFFMYSEEEIDRNLMVDVDFSDVSLEEALQAICEQASLKYEIVDNYVLITKKSAVVNQNAQQERVTVRGVVTDEKGETLPGVNVVIEDTGIGTITDENGVYEISCYPGNLTYLVFSFIGMETQVVQVGNYTEIDITLIADVSELGEVVVNGLFERRKETYTGTTNTVSGDQLLQKGTKNIIESLNQLDPSFRIIENNEFGSDPNRMPEVRFRGTSSFDDQLLDESDKNLLRTDPNLPTFILDGFRVELEDVIDLDMHRVESITILKDAVAAAIYGSRGANGVFVIKTKAPVPGEIQVNYSANVGVNIPDLATYDLLNGKELLQYQENIGLYGEGAKEQSIEGHNQIKRWIYEGVDTDWKAQPVQNSVSHQHTLSLTGGDQAIRYGITMNYNKEDGVMKGSSRENIGTMISLGYHMNEKVQFNNTLSVNRNIAESSAYGNFQDYLTMPNYFPLYDQQGELNETFGGIFFGERMRYNPLAEAMSGNFQDEKYTAIRNNFSANWRISNKFRLSVALGYSLKNSTDEQFLSPNSLTYVSSEIPEDDRGELTIHNREDESFSSNVMLNFNHGFSGHMINATVGGSGDGNTSVLTGMVAQGFSDDRSFPSFAKGYEINGFPIGQETKSRNIGLLGSVNYAYKNTFLLDGSYRLDGSSAFGTEEKFAPFFSVGTGVNLSNINLIKNTSWINELRFNATYGETGSVSFAPYQARDMFSYYASSRYMGNTGVQLIAMGNESLVWQTTESKELSGGINLWDGLIDLTCSYYHRNTVDMIINVTLPASTGFESMTANLGEMISKGVEFNLRSILYKSSKSNLVLAINGNRNTSVIGDLGDALKDYNDRIKQAADDNMQDPSEQLKYTSQFEEGGSLTSLYAVRSLGIDPQTGQELFLDREGNPTWEWSSEDMVIVGNTAPKIEGNMSLNYAYGRFAISLSAMYRLGGQAFNQTLLNRVENADKWLNVDRRVLTQAWQKPGDVVPYKSVLPNEPLTNVSSRFVQDNDQFQISGLNISYAFGEKVCRPLFVEALSVGLTMRDIYYTSTIKRERGINYPFSRTIGFSLNANF